MADARTPRVGVEERLSLVLTTTAADRTARLGLEVSIRSRTSSGTLRLIDSRIPQRQRTAAISSIDRVPGANSST